MNYYPQHATTAIVRSSDGVEFAVLTDARAIAYELAFARTKTAAQLSAHGDFVRVDNASAMTEAPRPQDETPIELIAKLTAIGGDEPEALVRARRRWGWAGFDRATLDQHDLYGFCRFCAVRHCEKPECRQRAIDDPHGPVQRALRRPHDSLSD